LVEKSRKGGVPKKWQKKSLTRETEPGARLDTFYWGIIERSPLRAEPRDGEGKEKVFQKNTISSRRIKTQGAKRKNGLKIKKEEGRTRSFESDGNAGKKQKGRGKSQLRKAVKKQGWYLGK